MFKKIFKKNKINKVIFNEFKELFDLYKMFKENLGIFILGFSSGVFSTGTFIYGLYFYGKRKYQKKKNTYKL